jgi:AAA15 family ATPase/GTPase
MLKSLKIENFRCFKNFEIQQLGKINLIVGSNNSGKSSILEAIYLLKSDSKFESIKEMMIGRGEYFSGSEDQRKGYELDVRHLYNNYQIESNKKILISANNQSEGISIFVKNEEDNDLTEEFSDEEYQKLNLVIEDLGEVKQRDHKFQLSATNGLPFEYFSNRARNFKYPAGMRVQFVGSSSLLPREMMKIFDDHISLTNEEQFIIEALQSIEPNIIRLNTKSNELLNSRSGSPRIGFIILLSGEDLPLPIGNMGDGIWRMLALALAVVYAKNGVLLVDEIDTGLHFSVMTKMWKMIWETAKRLNVQVFATTHSDDCWKSLAEIADAEPLSDDGILIHRIEKGKSKSIIFTQEELAIAPKLKVEVR